MITIAIPASNGRLFGHFGGCSQFAFVTADPEQRRILGIRTAEAPPHQPGLFPLWLREQGTTVVIVGGIGQRAIALLAQYGIPVRAGEPGAEIEKLAAAYLGGQLSAEPEGCSHHRDGEDHHPHHPGEHHHGH